jgi:hypothetical protein
MVCREHVCIDPHVGRVGEEGMMEEVVSVLSVSDTGTGVGRVSG